MLLCTEAIKGYHEHQSKIFLRLKDSYHYICRKAKTYSLIVKDKEESAFE